MFTNSATRVRATCSVRFGVRGLTIGLNTCLARTVVISLRVSTLRRVRHGKTCALIVRLRITRHRITGLCKTCAFIIGLRRVTLNVVSTSKTCALVNGVRLINGGLVSTSETCTLIVSFRTITISELNVRDPCPFLNGLRRVEANSVGLRSVLLEVARNERLRSSHRASLRLTISVRRLSFLLRFLGRLDVLSNEMVRSGTTFVTIILYVVSANGRVRVGDLRELLSRVVLHGLRTSSRFEENDEARATKASTRENGGRDYQDGPGARYFRALSVLGFLCSST